MENESKQAAPSRQRMMRAKASHSQRMAGSAAQVGSRLAGGRSGEELVVLPIAKGAVAVGPAVRPQAGSRDQGRPAVRYQGHSLQ